MCSFPIFCQGFFLYLGIICSIGPQNAFLIQQAALGSSAFRFATASAATDVLLINVGAMGIGAGIAANPPLQQAISVLGAAVLSVYGLRCLCAGLQVGSAPSAASSRTTNIVWATVTLLNLTYYIDTLIIIGGSAASFGSEGTESFAAGACFGSIVWFYGIVAVATRAAKILFRPIVQRLINVAGGSAMMLSASGLALGAFG